MALSKPNELPSYLRTFRAFQFGERIADDTGGCLDERLGTLLTNPQNESTMKLVACELIASSIGRSCLQDTSWNVFISLLLFKTKYVASAASIGLAKSYLEELLQTEPSGEYLDCLASLHKRLCSAVKEEKRTNPLLSKKQLNNLLKSFRDNAGELVVAGSDLICLDPSVSECLRITHLRPRAITSINIGFGTEPTAENIEAVRILFYRFSDTISSVRCDCFPSESTSPDQLSVLSTNFWERVNPELKRLNRLKYFESYNFPISDDLAATILSRSHLTVFRLATYGRLTSTLAVGKNLVNAIEQSADLKVLEVQNEAFWNKFGHELKPLSSRIIMQNVGLVFAAD
ncbi:MAG TPA: hypothetical protein PKD64_19210 [Pirellulaceae bacterium]|nr:hypothetical protein [Pirellulaceae bacterium]HMO94320.1 hypothetical protein [Pirellulaceae bacterium]HMP71605.1 hypothetical protein [Pirellulaceae bacterium]